MSVKKSELLIVADYTEETLLTLEELCEACHISSDYILQLIEYAIIPPHDHQETWIFDLDELKRIQTTLRLQRHLDINLAGAAMVLDLLQELEDLRAQVELMQKHHL